MFQNVAALNFTDIAVASFITGIANRCCKNSFHNINVKLCSYWLKELICTMTGSSMCWWFNPSYEESQYRKRKSRSEHASSLPLNAINYLSMQILASHGPSFSREKKWNFYHIERAVLIKHQLFAM